MWDIFLECVCSPSVVIPNTCNVYCVVSILFKFKIVYYSLGMILQKSINNKLIIDQLGPSSPIRYNIKKNNNNVIM